MFYQKRTLRILALPIPFLCMNDDQKKYVLWGATAVLTLCMIAWLIMLFWPKAPAPQQPTLVEAIRPQYNYNQNDYIQENPDLFLQQLVPLLGNLEGAVQQGDAQNITDAATLLRTSLVRWHDATLPALQPSIQRYITATDTILQAKGDKTAYAAPMVVLSEIKTLALESQRSELQSLSE